MFSQSHSTRFSIISALLCVAGATVLGCSADDPGVVSKKDASAAGGSMGTGGSSSTTLMTSGTSGSGNAGSFVGTGGNGGSGNAGMSGSGGAGGEDCTTDNDLDGTPDCKDECPFDKLKTKKGVCDC